MEIYMDLLGAIRAECLAAVVRDMKLYAEHIDSLVIIWVDAYLAEIHWARIGGGHLCPACAGILRAINISLFPMLDSRIDDIRIAAIHIHPDASHRAFRQTFAEFGPGTPGIG